MAFILEVFMDNVRDVDPDIRFMALSDLDKHLKEHSSISKQSILRIYSALKNGLDDTDSEVKNQAVKCYKNLGAFCSHDPQSKTSRGRVSDYATDKKIVEKVVRESYAMSKAELAKRPQGDDFVTSCVPTLALRYFLQSFRPANAREMVAFLLDVLEVAQTGVVEYLDQAEILNDIFDFYGSGITHEQMSYLFGVLERCVYSGEGVLSKKCISLVGKLCLLISTREQDLCAQIGAEILRGVARKGHELVALELLLRVTLNAPDFFNDNLDALFSVLETKLHLESLGQSVDFDEMAARDKHREMALSCVENMLQNREFALKFWPQLLSFVKSFATYDPYTLVNEDSDDDNDNDSDGDTQMDFEDSDDENDFDDDSEFADDDSGDDSWRMRKAALHILRVLVSDKNLANKLSPRSNLVTSALNEGLVSTLCGRLADSSELVVTEALSALSAVTQNTTESELSRFMGQISQAVAAELVSCRSIDLLNRTLHFLTVLAEKKCFNLEYVTEIVTALHGLMQSGRLRYKLNDELLNFYTEVFRNHSVCDLRANLQTFFFESLLEEGLKTVNRNLILSTVSCLKVVVTKFRDNAFDLSEILAQIVHISGSKDYDSEVRENCTSLLLQFMEKHATNLHDLIMSSVESNLKYDSLFESTMRNLTGFYAKYANKYPLPRFIESCTSTVLANKSKHNVAAKGYDDLCLYLQNLLENRVLIADLSQGFYVQLVESLLLLRNIDAKIVHVIAMAAKEIEVFNISLTEQLVELVKTFVFEKSPSVEFNQPLTFLCENLSHKINGTEFLQTLVTYVASEKLELSQVLLKSEICGVVAREIHARSFIVEQERYLVKFDAENGVLDNDFVFCINFLGTVATKQSLDVEFLSLLETLRKISGKDEQISMIFAENVGKFILKDSSKKVGHIIKSLPQCEALLVTLRYLVQQNVLSQQHREEVFTCVMHYDTLVSAETLALIISADCEMKFYAELQSNFDDNSKVSLILNTIQRLIALGYFFEDEAKLGLLTNEKFVELLRTNLEKDTLSIEVGVTSIIMSIIHRKVDAFYQEVLFGKQMLLKLLAKLKPNKNYIKKLQIGSTKYKIDEGSDLRKNVYEILLSVVLEVSKLEKPDAQFWLAEICTKLVEFGMKDSTEILGVVSILLVQIVEIDLGCFLEDKTYTAFKQRCTEILTKKVSDKATKQDLSEQKEKVTCVSNVMLKVNEEVKKLESGTVKSNWEPFFLEHKNLLIASAKY